MLGNLIIFSFCIVAITASGEFTVLNCPKSLSFKGNEALPSDVFFDVISAAQGYPIRDNSQWSGLIIEKPFDLPSSVIVTIVDGLNKFLDNNTPKKTYKLEGSSIHNSLQDLSSQLEADNVQVCDIDFNYFDQAIAAFHNCFGDVVLPKLEKTDHLNPSLHSADKYFNQIIQYIYGAAENLEKLQKNRNVLIIRASVTPIAKAHGEKSDAMLEAQKLISNAVTELNVQAQKYSKNEALVVAIANEVNDRVKRQAGKPTSVVKDYKLDKETYNLAEDYSEDYPVIFNIILWFMVAFALSLVAICYAIGSMDPGRDSIIYRMTSTRMKKDN